MVHLGDKADTLKEMDQVLHFSRLGKNVHAAFGSYLEFLSKETGDLSLKTANKIYQSIKFPPEESFLRECAQHFKSSAKVLDFSKSEAASSAIRFAYMSNLRLNGFEIPYKGNSLSMLILLLLAVDGISHLEQNLSEAILRDVVSNLTEKTVKVYLPNSKMETSFQLMSHPVALGMQSAFDENKADFSGFDKNKYVYLSEV